MLLVAELLMLAAAISASTGAPQGQRLAVDPWQHRDWIRARRALIQRERSVPDAVIFQQVTVRIDPANVAALIS